MVLTTANVGYAKNEPVIYLEAERISDKNEIEVDVVIGNNPGIISVILEIGYDSNSLKIVSVNDAGKLGTSMHSDNYNLSPYQFTWINGTSMNNYSENGVIATIVFEPSDATDEYNFELKLREAYNYDLNEVTFKTIGDKIYNEQKNDTATDIVLPEKESDNIIFKDIYRDTYYYKAVLWAVEEGITDGTSETAFSPDMICTRAQAVTFMWRAAGSPAPVNKEMIFTDVPENAYYYDAVLWAVENGITTGTNGGTTFSPDMNCSRGQIVTMLWRANGAAVADEENPFADVSENAYYYNAVLWAVENNITTGTSGTSFSPDMACSRAQIVTFLYRGLNK